MADFFDTLIKKKGIKLKYLADNLNPNRLQQPIDYSPEATRQKGANIAGAVGGLYTGIAGIGGDIEALVRAELQSTGALQEIGYFVARNLPLPDHLLEKVEQAENMARMARKRNGHLTFTEELGRIFDESDTVIHNSMDAREDITNFFNDDGFGNSVLKNTPIGNNGVGDLLKEAHEDSWLVGEIFSPSKIPKFLKGVPKQAKDFINTGNNIGDKVVDGVVQTTKVTREAGKNIYQTLEEGMSPELATTNGQKIKVKDVEFDNQPMKSAEYFDDNGINEVTGARTVGDGHLQDYNRGLEEAIETAKIQNGTDELTQIDLEKVKNKFVEDFYAKNPDLIDEGIIRVDQDGRTVLRKADNLQAKELNDKPLFSGAGTKGSTDPNELLGELGGNKTLNDTDISMRTFSVNELIEGSSLERLVGKEVTDLIEVRLAYPNILAKEAKTGKQMSSYEIVDEIKGLHTNAKGGRYQSPDGGFVQGFSEGGVTAGNSIDKANFYKATLGWIEESGGVATNARVMAQIDKMIESGIFVKPKDPKKVKNRFDAPYTEVDTKGKFDRLPPLLKQKMYNEAERLATIEEINLWAQKNRKELTRYDATNIEPLMLTRDLKYDGQLLKDWVWDIEKKATSSTKTFDEQIRGLALGINPNTGRKFSSFKVDEKTFIHELENHLNQRVQQGNRGGTLGNVIKTAKIDDAERSFFDMEAVRKYDHNEYQGLKGESEARFGERNWKSTNEELVETGRSGFDRFPKEHSKNAFNPKEGFDYYPEQRFSGQNFLRPIENSKTKIVDGDDEANVLKLVKQMMKNPEGYKMSIQSWLKRAKGQNPYDLEFSAPMPTNAKEAKVGTHLPHTPKNPHPEVGDRFEVEFAGGLEAKRLADIEAMKNGSILPMIWDSSSANYYIRSVSGHSFKYPKKFMTHGGDDFSRVIKNQELGIGGASNYEVVKSIRDRVDAVRKLNLEKGGSGDVFLMTRRMAPYRTGGNHPMDFSVQPTQLSLAVLDNQPLMKADIARLDKSIREQPVIKTVKEGGKEVKVKTYPFKSFKGVMTPKGRDQLFGTTGSAKIGTSAGNLRKAFMNRIAIKQNQKAFHFNIQDIDMALTDPALRGVPYGYMGNAIIKAPDEGIKVLKGKNASYPYDFGGKYFGTMNHNFHMRTLYGKQYDEVLEELTKKNKGREKPQTMETVHSQVVDALSKRKNLDQSSVFVDNDVYDKLKGLQRPLEQKVDSLLETKSLWGYPNQNISSAGTSINSSKPAEAFTKLLKKDAFKKGSKNLDIGGGKFDNVNTLLKDKAGATNVVYDPFNRTKAHNAKVVKKMAGGRSDTVTINNTLNVIEDTPNQIRVLEQAKDAVKKDGKVYISVYEGDRTGTGRPTSKGWQRHQKVEDYLETVKQVFPNARIENKIIVIDN